MPSDEEFKARWAKKHGGKTAGWGILKKNWVLSEMTRTRSYQMGIWQGRVDAANGLEYSEERENSPYNLGYHRGYTGFQSDFRGFDKQTQERFMEKYVEEV